MSTHTISVGHRTFTATFDAAEQAWHRTYHATVDGDTRLVASDYCGDYPTAKTACEGMVRRCGYGSAL